MSRCDKDMWQIKTEHDLDTVLMIQNTQQPYSSFQTPHENYTVYTQMLMLVMLGDQ